MINKAAFTVAGDVATIRIPTRGGYEILFVDTDLFPAVKKIEKIVLYKDPKGRKMARADKRNGQVLIHRYLFEVPKGSKLVWLNENTLDLRRRNLQIVDREGNVTLIDPPPIKADEPVKGVVFHKASQKFTSRPFYQGKRYSLGYFDTKEEAIAETLLFRSEGPDSPKLIRNQRKGKK